MVNKRWVRFNAINGTILEDLAVSEDDIKVDINGYDEVTLNIPAYTLPDEARLNWANEYFRPWTVGVALINDDTNACEAAGIVVKRGFTGSTEMITVVAYNVAEYLKKVRLPAIYSNLTSNSTLTLSGANWGEVYAEAIRAGMSMSGAPAGTTYYSNLVLTPNTGSTITRTIERKNQTTVYGFITDLRDGDETKGEEIRFVPTLDGTTIKWTQVNGTTTVPQINSNIQLEASTTTISGTGSATWKTAEYTWDDDGTTIYNRLVINGSSDDEAPFVGVGGTTSANTPTLTEAFDSGTDLSPEQMTEQLSSRLTGSMATSKTITVSIVEDVTDFWRTGVGTMLTIHSGEKTAGAGVYGRVVEISWNNTREGEYELTVAPPASRYPRLPSQKEREPDYTGPGDSSTGGFDSGGLPDISGGNGGTLPGGNFPTPGDPDYPDYEDGGIVWEEPEEPFAGDQENSARVVVNAKNVLPGYNVTTDYSYKINPTPISFNTYISTQFSTPSVQQSKISPTNFGKIGTSVAGNYIITSYTLTHEGLAGEPVASNQAGSTVTQAQILNISYASILDSMMEHDPFPDEIITLNGYATTAPYGTVKQLEDVDIFTWSGASGAVDFYVNGYLYVLFTLRAEFTSSGNYNSRLSRQAMFAIPYDENTGVMGVPVSIKSPFSTFSDRIRVIPHKRIQNEALDQHHGELPSLSNFFVKNNEMWIITPGYTDSKEGVYYSLMVQQSAPTVDKIEDFRDGLYVNFEAPLAPYAVPAPEVAAIKPVSIQWETNGVLSWDYNLNTKPVTLGTVDLYYSRRYADPVSVIVDDDKVYVFYNIDEAGASQDWNNITGKVDTPNEKSRRKLGNRVYIATIGEWEWKSGKEYLWPRNFNKTALRAWKPLMYLTPDKNIILDMENSSTNIIYKPNNRTNYGRSSYIISGENGTRSNIVTENSLMKAGGDRRKFPYISKTVGNKTYAMLWESSGSGTSYHRYSIVENMTYQKTFDTIGGKVWIQDGDLYEHSSNTNTIFQTHDGPKTLLSLTYPFTNKTSKWLMASSNYATSGISAMGVQEEGNTVYTWGISSAGANGNGLTTGNVSPAQPVAGLPGGEIKKILSVNLSKFVLYENGELWGWGSRVAGYANAGASAANATTPILVRTGVLDFKCNNATLVILDEFRKIWMKGISLFSSVEIAWTEILLDDPSDIITKISLSGSNTKQLYAVTASGWLLAAGQKVYGMLLDGSDDRTYQTTLKRTFPNIVEVGASENAVFMINKADALVYAGRKPAPGAVSWTSGVELVNTTSLPKFEKIYAENSFIYLTSSVGSIYTIGWTGAPGAVAYTPAGFERQFVADMPDNWATRPILIWHDVVDKLEDDEV